MGHEISRRGRGGRKRKIISKAVATEFWETVAESDHARLASKKGCYVFVLSAGRGSMPWYVGKTEKNKRTLKQEVFADEKLGKYKTILGKSKRRSPQMFLVVRAAGQGRLGGAIDDLETLLIWMAAHRNKKLLNKKKRDTHPAKLLRIANTISLKGVFQAGQGRPTKAEEAFELAMKSRPRKATSKKRIG